MSGYGVRFRVRVHHAELEDIGYNVKVDRLVLKIRLYPTKSQARQLEEALETCRLVYNSLLLDRKYRFQVRGELAGYFEQKKYLPTWKRDHPELREVYSQVLQDVAHRVSLAFDAFFDRVRKGETPGFPRFKGAGRYDSITYTQGKNVRVGDSTIELPKFGKVKARLHRRPWGEVKNCTIRRQNGKWYACLCQEVEPERQDPSGAAVGVDLGLKTFAALSNGEVIENPHFFRRDEKALAKAQRKLARHQCGTAARRKARRVVCRIHERIRNRRHDFCHQTARRLVNRYGVIAVEKLNVRGMMAVPVPKPDPENPGRFLPNGASAKANLNKRIADVAWSHFRSILASKAERAGRKVVSVDPAHTSQDCSGCGYRASKKLTERWHLCPMCGLSLDRDTNAAVNILALGQQCLPVATG